MSESLDKFLATASEESRLLAIQTAERVGSFTIDYLSGRGWPEPSRSNGDRDLTLDEALRLADKVEGNLAEEIKRRKEIHDIIVEAVTKGAGIALRLSLGGLA